MAWNTFGIANVLASALLLLLGLLFLRARRSEFAVAFAVYSVLAACQKFTGGMWLYFETPLPPSTWQTLSTLFLLASTPVLAHALAAFTWERAFTSRAPLTKALLYLPFVGLAAVAFVGGLAFRWFSLAMAGVFMAILGVFLVAVTRKARRAGTPLARSQARYVLVYLVIALAFSAEARVILVLYGILPWWEVSFAYMVATGILLYGVLRAHVFDIDVKVKWTLRQSTVAGIFVGVFFVVSELAASVLSSRVGTVVGIAATGLLVFALAPLQRAAERFADRAMPGVAQTPEYLQYRRFEIYRQALLDAAEDGRVTERERAVLDGLRRNLGVSDADAAAMERDLRAGAPAGGSL